MYSFINKTNSRVNDMRKKRINYLIAKNNEMQRRRLVSIGEKKQEINSESIYNFEKINDKEEKITINLDEIPDTNANTNANVNETNDNKSLFVLKNNILSLLNFASLNNLAYKNILDDINANEEKDSVSNIWNCVNSVVDAVDTNNAHKPKFKIDKNKIERIKEEENSRDLVNYKEQMINKVEQIFVKAKDDMSNEVTNDILQYTNVIIEHTRKSLHERLDNYLNAFLENLFK